MDHSDSKNMQINELQNKRVIIKNDLTRTRSAGGNGVGVQGLRPLVRVFFQIIKWVLIVQHTHTHIYTQLCRHLYFQAPLLTQMDSAWWIAIQHPTADSKNMQINEHADREEFVTKMVEWWKKSKISEGELCCRLWSKNHMRRKEFWTVGSLQNHIKLGKVWQFNETSWKSNG